MKKIAFTLVLVFTCMMSTAQKSKSTKTGKTTLEELKMERYEKDTTANVLVLFEHGNLYIENKNYDFQTDFYFRKKIFSKEGLNQSIIKIRSYRKEKIKDIVAITYNLTSGRIQKTYLLPSAIYTNKLDEYWTETSFTLPNVKPGSVIEYTYSKISPYPQLDDWYFQSDIPKLESNYDSAILGNFKYNVKIIGNLQLSRNNPSILKKCMHVEGAGTGDCEVISVSMTNVPAFKEEKYMLSKRNYISRLSFDYASFTDIRGKKKNYLTNWKAADKSLKNVLLNNQANKKGFLKKRMPQNLFASSNPLEKAKAIYKYIQNNYTWNGKNWSEDSKIKDTFLEKTGSVYDINLTLYNSLQAADIESYIAMISTRENGLPTTLYPIITDFNYLIVKVVINNETYFLDATDKQLPFGLVPFKCLNGKARIMNFKKGSFWEKIHPLKNSFSTSKVKFTINEDSELNGNLMIRKGGYEAVKQRKKHYNIDEEKILDAFESKNIGLEAETYSQKDFEKLEVPTEEKYEIIIEPTAFYGTDALRINLFLIDRLESNPFKLEKRLYPVDYGYSRKYNYYLSFEIPKNYMLKKVPESVSGKLPNKGGYFIFNVSSTPMKLTVSFSYKINKVLYSTDEYQYLKEFYDQIVKIQNSFIELKKI